LCLYLFSINQELEGTEAMELVKELAVTEDKQKEEQNKKRIEELTSTIKDLQKQLKTSHENQKELKLLLDVFKGSVKESRSKVRFIKFLLNFRILLINLLIVWFRLPSRIPNCLTSQHPLSPISKSPT
jgi:TolA-binding protein